MSYRILTVFLFAAMYATALIDPPLGFSGSSGVSRAAMSPYHLLTWGFAACMYFLPFAVKDPGEFRDRRAGLIRRFAGFVVDFHVAFILVGVPLVMVILTISYVADGTFSWSVERTESAADWLAFLSAIPTFVLLLSLPLSRNRRSPGQVTLGYGLKLEERLSLGRACRRTIVGYLSLCAVWLTGPLAAARDDRRMWHDRMYGVHPLEVRTALTSSWSGREGAV
jgi:hypothetical protein